MTLLLLLALLGLFLGAGTAAGSPVPIGGSAQRVPPPALGGCHAVASDAAVCLAGPSVDPATPAVTDPSCSVPRADGIVSPDCAPLAETECSQTLEWVHPDAAAIDAWLGAALQKQLGLAQCVVGGPAPR